MSLGHGTAAELAPQIKGTAGHSLPQVKGMDFRLLQLLSEFSGSRATMLKQSRDFQLTELSILQATGIPLKKES